MRSYKKIVALFRPATAVVTTVLSLGLAVGGCGSDADPETAAELTRYDFCERWAAAACSEEVVSVCQASSADACKTAQSAACLEDLPNAFVDRGVDGCIGAVEAAYGDADLTAEELDLVLRYRGACSQIIIAHESSETCQFDSDCEPDLSCILKDSDEGTCEEAVTVEPGFSCSKPEETCEEGFFCDGENCLVALEEGEDCKNDSQCEASLYCDKTCVLKAEVDDECSSDAQCGSGICYEIEGEKTCRDRLRLSPAEPMCDSLK